MSGVSSAFTPDLNTAHVVIRFGAIDGPGGVLGETQEPEDATAQTQLTMDLDPAEPWTEAYLEDVIRHEWGHALGVGHTDEPGNTMLAEYDGTVHVLGTWDVGQAIERYGEPSSSAAAPRRQRFLIKIDQPGIYEIEVTSDSPATVKVYTQAQPASADAPA